VRAGGVAGAQPCLAYLVRHVEKMQPVVRSGTLEETAHPLATGRRVGGKVEHHRQARLEQRHDMVAHRLAQSTRIAHIILERLLLILVETGEPRIFDNANRARTRRQPGRERRLSGGNLAADHV